MSDTIAGLKPDARELLGVLEGRRAFIGPEQVVIDLTNRCNNNCIGCWTRSPLLRDREAPERWRSQEIPFESMINLLNDLYDLGTRRVRFTGGGEPLMHERFEEILRACKQREMITCITTNGTLFTPEWVDLLVDLPIDELAVSLWAASAGGYSRTHPNKTGRTLERMKELLTALCHRRRLRPRVTICNVLFAMNYHEAEAMFDFAREVGVDAVYFALLDPVAERTEPLLLSPEDANRLNKMLDRIASRNAALPRDEQLELENWEGFRRRVEAIRAAQASCGEYDAAVIDAIPCYVGWIFCRILADGTVVPCCRGSNLPLGNINTEGFKEVWQGETYAEFRHRAKTWSKSDPYFAPIGCHKTCDNLMHNEMVHRRLAALPPEELARLQRLIEAERGGSREGDS